MKDKLLNKDMGSYKCPLRQETLFSEQIFTDDLTLNEECHNMFTRECKIIKAYILKLSKEFIEKLQLAKLLS